MLDNLIHMNDELHITITMSIIANYCKKFHDYISASNFIQRKY